MGKKEIKKRSGEAEMMLISAAIDSILSKYNVTKYQVITIADRLLVSVFGQLADNAEVSYGELVSLEETVMDCIRSHIMERTGIVNIRNPVAEA